MNAISEAVPRVGMTTTRSTSTLQSFVWLLKREYWEHRGGFLWAPIWAGGIMLLLSLMGLIAGEIGVRKAGIRINDLRLGDLTNNLSPEVLRQFGAGVDAALLAYSGIIAVVLFFVSFFYLIGALYDDRRDRSILFWKSLPITDTETVLSKVITATLVAPTFAVGAAIAMMFGFLLLLSLFVLLHGVNPITTIWMTASPLSVAAKLIVLIPVNALWALPCVGWLLLASAFAKRAAFLWAVLVPVFTGVVVSWFDLMQGFHIPDTSYWTNVVGRVLFSIMPGSWMENSQFKVLQHANGPGDALGLLSFSAIGDVLTRPSLWIGVAAGAALIAGAIWMRRRRDDS